MYHESNSELGGVFDNFLDTLNKGVSVVERNMKSGFDIYNKIQQIRMVQKERSEVQRQAEEVAAMRRAARERQIESVSLRQQRASVPLMQRLGIGGTMMPVLFATALIGGAMWMFLPARKSSVLRKAY